MEEAGSKVPIGEQEANLRPTVFGTLLAVPVFLATIFVSYLAGGLVNYLCGAIYRNFLGLSLGFTLPPSYSILGFQISVPGDIIETHLGLLLQGGIAGGLAIFVTGILHRRASIRALAYVTSAALLLLYANSLLHLFDLGGWRNGVRLNELLPLIGCVVAMMAFSHIRWLRPSLPARDHLAWESDQD